MKSVSIIIPAWNEAVVLRPTVEALLQVDYDREKCEIILVAGGGDDTYAIAQGIAPIMKVFSRYVVILQGPHGKNYAIQQGIKEAKHDMIVLLDGDTIVSKGWLKNMVDPIQQGSCDLTIANPEPVKRNWISDYYMITKQYVLDRIVTYSGHAMAFRASTVVNRVEYFFDKQVKVGVDYLLAKRFLEDGSTCMFVKDACVITHLPSSLKYFVLSELRWLTALINIDGISYRALASNIGIVAALILAIPLFDILSMFAWVFNIIYMSKRTRMFLTASTHYSTDIRKLFGFIMLSYAQHIIGFICYMKYFLGLSKETYLYQGQRH